MNTASQASILLAVFLQSCASCGKPASPEDVQTDDDIDFIEEETEEILSDITDPAEDLEIDGSFDVATEIVDAEDIEDLVEDDFELPDVPYCGNGVIDPGETCDDRNRLNGDGCDWLCQIGDGTPPGPPSSAACHLSAATGPIPLDSISHTARTIKPLPFIWAGSEFATLYWEDTPPTLKFRRFDSGGRTIGTEYTVSTPDMVDGYDIVWTGSSYGLFYVDTTAGIYFSALAADGTLRSGPTLVVADIYAGMPSADSTTRGFVLAWMTDGPVPGGWNLCNEPAANTVKIRVVGPAGETSGLPGPVTLISDGMGPPDVATGALGFGIGVMHRGSPGVCHYEFVHISRDLTTISDSIFLSEGAGSEIKWNGTDFTTAWTTNPWDPHICIARFNASGILYRAPICTQVIDYTLDSMPRLEEHCDGLTVLFSGRVTGPPPWYVTHSVLRTDLSGVAVDPRDDISCCSSVLGGFNLDAIDNDTLAVFLALRDSSTLETNASLFYFSTSP